MTAPFFFGSPLRARAASKDWGRVSALFEDTLRSQLNQSADEFSVIVACHDVPNVKGANDPRVTFLVSGEKTPTTLYEQMNDKHHKGRMIAAELRRRGGGYLMTVDADDLVSARVVQYVRQDADPYGYILNQGYEFDYARKRVRIAPRFNHYCGSSAIIRFAPGDLPVSAEDSAQSLSDRFANHVQWPEVARGLGRPLAALPFRGAMYVVNNGENWTVSTSSVGWRRKLLRAIVPDHEVTQAMREEFALRF